eukprot:scaffold123826_cov22-Tisochrysis_lutea.AAC.1
MVRFRRNATFEKTLKYLSLLSSSCRESCPRSPICSRSGRNIRLQERRRALLLETYHFNGLHSVTTRGLYSVGVLLSPRSLALRLLLITVYLLSIFTPLSLPSLLSLLAPLPPLPPLPNGVGGFGRRARTPAVQADPTRRRSGGQDFHRPPLHPGPLCCC